MEATCALYGMIHARYVLTTAGLEAMYAKYTLQVRKDTDFLVKTRRSRSRFTSCGTKSDDVNIKVSIHDNSSSTAAVLRSFQLHNNQINAQW